MTTKVSGSVLANTSVTSGTYGGTTISPVIVVDAQGRLTSAANASISFPQAFPSGTRLVFNQTSAPTGWTKDTTAELNDSIMRIVTGTVGSGGSTAFSTFNGQTTVGATTLSTAQMPSHQHGIYGITGSNWSGTNGYNYGIGQNAVGYQTDKIQAAGSGGSHTHSITTSIKYNDFIIASKD